MCRLILFLFSKIFILNKFKTIIKRNGYKHQATSIILLKYLYGEKNMNTMAVYNKQNFKTFYI